MNHGKVYQRAVAIVAERLQAALDGMSAAEKPTAEDKAQRRADYLATVGGDFTKLYPAFVQQYGEDGFQAEMGMALRRARGGS